jgi:excisionase family DNA binding protein
MANRTRSHQQIKSRQRPKRSKLRTQTTSNRRSNRANAPDLDTQSLSVSGAALRLGVSVSTIKRRCDEGKLAWFRTGPHGHIRIPVEAVEKLRQGGGTQGVPVPSAVAAKRANADELRADLEVRKLELEVRKLDGQESVAAHEKVELARAQKLATKAQLKETRLQTARFAERQREAAQAEERASWRRGWFNGAVQEFPNWVSPEQDRELRTAIDAELDRWDVGDGDAVGRALDRVIERTITPWITDREERVRREKLVADTIRGFEYSAATADQKARAAADARASLSQLPLGASESELRAVVDQAVSTVKREIEEAKTRARREQLVKSAAWSLSWNATEDDKTQAADAVRSALLNLSLQASQAEEQALVTRILAPIKKDLQDRVVAQQELQRRKGQKSLLITVAVVAASNHLSELRDDLDPEPDDAEFAELKRDLEAEVRKTLEQSLTGDESYGEATKIACDVVDEELELDDSHPSPARSR